MNRRHIIFFALLTAAIGAYIVAWTYPRLKLIEKQGPLPESVAANLPVELESTVAVIIALFNNGSDLEHSERAGPFENKFPDGTAWNHFFLYRNEGTPQSLFPSDVQLLQNKGADPTIERYMRIPPERRSRDFYLYEPTGDIYWESEYFYNGRPAKFRCSFIVHIEPAESSQTKVEIFEYQPTIWIGRYIGLSAHSILPALLNDIRPVDATTQDRKDVLGIILTSPVFRRPEQTP